MRKKVPINAAPTQNMPAKMWMILSRIRKMSIVLLRFSNVKPINTCLSVSSSVKPVQVFANLYADVIEKRGERGSPAPGDAEGDFAELIGFRCKTRSAAVPGGVSWAANAAESPFAPGAN
jgi:hypothetical protein